VFSARAQSVDNETEGRSSSCGGALPDFSWQGMSATDDGAAVELGGAKKRARTETEPREEEAEGKEEVAQAEPSGDPADLLFDAFMFGDQFSFFNGGGVYEPAATSMDGLLGGDAVLCNDDSLGLWSFDDSVCYY
jgi:EREBP-like factor